MSLYGKRMRYTRFIDAQRNIKKNIASYVSIVLIAFLGVTTFLCTDYSALALQRACAEEYDLRNYRDLEIVLPVPIVEDDMDQYLEACGIKDAERVFFGSGRVTSEKTRKRIRVISLTERINLVDVVQGRMPETEDECVVEERLATEMGWKTGERIEVQSASGENNGFLKYDEFTITGMIHHPDHVNPQTPEDLYVVVFPGAFDLSSKDFMMAVEAVVYREDGEERFGDAHQKKVDETAEKIREYAEILINMISEGAEYKEMTEQIKDAAPLVTDINGNSSYENLKVDCENLLKLKMTFSLMFLLIAAIVIYATIGKMIEEQRMQVGTMKAFGVRNHEIFSKYLEFGFSATVAGVLIGIIFARYVIEIFILSCYDRYYTFDTVRPVTSIMPTALALLAGSLLAVLSCFSACRRLLSIPAVGLLQPKVPQMKKSRPRKERPISLYARLILRNMRTDAKRVSVTMAGVAGVCALVVTGFTLKSASEGCPARQYSLITAYDEKVTFTEDGKAEREVEEVLQKFGVSYLAVCEVNVAITMGSSNVGTLTICDEDAFSEYYHLNDIETGLPLKASDDGVFIPRRIAEIYSLKKGDRISLTTTDAKSADVKVAGIFENYIGIPLIMSRSHAEKVFGMGDISNTFYVKLMNCDAKSLEKELSRIRGYNGTVRADEGKVMFDNASSVVNSVIVMMIFLAALMAAVVLTNLTITFMLQKKNELTIMRIHGFTVAETLGYVLRETVFTTLCGIVFGCFMGRVVSYRILRSLEQPYTQLVRDVSVSAWLIGAGMTILFTAVINFVVLKRVGQLDLSDVT